MEAKINYSRAETLLFVSLKGCPPVEVKSRKTKENGIAHLRENGLQLPEEQRNRILSKILCFGGKSILKNFFVPRSGEKSFFRPSRGGLRPCCPEKF